MLSTSLLTEESSDYQFGDPASSGSGEDISIEIETDHGTVWQDTIDDMMASESLSSPGAYLASYDDVSGTFTFTVYDVNLLTVKTAFFKVTMT
jgi:hypothetical protein